MAIFHDLLSELFPSYLQLLWAGSVKFGALFYSSWGCNPFLPVLQHPGLCDGLRSLERDAYSHDLSGRFPSNFGQTSSPVYLNSTVGFLPAILEEFSRWLATGQ